MVVVSADSFSPCLYIGGVEDELAGHSICLHSRSLVSMATQDYTRDSSLTMTSRGEDCYLYFNSTCTKGESCPFRHCKAAKGTKTVCTRWQEGRCVRADCKFRHKKIKKNRNKVPCYWKKQQTGSQRPQCVFQHEKPRCIGDDWLPPTEGLTKNEEHPHEEPAPPPPAPLLTAAEPQLKGGMRAGTHETNGKKKKREEQQRQENFPSPTKKKIKQAGEKAQHKSTALPSHVAPAGAPVRVKTLEEIRREKAEQIQAENGKSPGTEAPSAKKPCMNEPVSLARAGRNVKPAARVQRKAAPLNSASTVAEGPLHKAARRQVEVFLSSGAEAQLSPAVPRSSTALLGSGSNSRPLREELHTLCAFQQSPVQTEPTASTTAAREAVTIPQSTAFRHCEEAKGTKTFTVCTDAASLLPQGADCKFRHKKIKKNRNKVPCYWKKQQTGSQRPQCVFQHEKPHCIGDDWLPPTEGLTKNEEHPHEEPAPPPPAPLLTAAEPQLKGGMRAGTHETNGKKKKREEQHRQENFPSPTKKKIKQAGEKAQHKSTALPSHVAPAGAPVRVKTLEEIRREKAEQIQAENGKSPGTEAPSAKKPCMNEPVSLARAGRNVKPAARVQRKAAPLNSASTVVEGPLHKAARRQTASTTAAREAVTIPKSPVPQTATHYNLDELMKEFTDDYLEVDYSRAGDDLLQELLDMNDN
ncbi:zinc finger CCCH domain-containing protein 11A-like [Centroberyx affinis]|uniref:zinc finger CCCH domain-containing protein 11A-like n=1 Tax=Centroberyx affinis TaxID=166261 RepID=UPI003A5C54D3